MTRFTPSPKTRAGSYRHKLLFRLRVYRAMGVTLALFGLMALAITALLTWWQ